MFIDMPVLCVFRRWDSLFSDELSIELGELSDAGPEQTIPALQARSIFSAPSQLKEVFGCD